jgi:hypothetical protein
VYSVTLTAFVGQQPASLLKLGFIIVEGPFLTHLISTHSDGATSVHAVDIDGDGDVDIPSASWLDNKIAWYESPLSWTLRPHLGDGLEGISGTPVLQGYGHLKADEIVTMRLSAAKSNSLCSLVVGLTQLGAAFKWGVLVPNPDLVIPGLLTNAMGQLIVSDRWPSNVPAGAKVSLQYWILDPFGPQGYSASNGLQGTASGQL